MSRLEDNFLNLVNAWKDDEDVIEYIEKDMNAFANYVHAVYTMETKISMASVLYNHDVEKYLNILKKIKQKICMKKFIRVIIVH